jgi:hypothetical protein
MTKQYGGNNDTLKLYVTQEQISNEQTASEHCDSRVVSEVL